MSLSSYPKVYALGHRAISDIFQGEVEITEKVDGSQYSFGIVNNQLFMRSKGQALYAENPEKMFVRAIDTSKKLYDAGLLKEGYTYRCEYVQKPKHNSLKYSRVPHYYLIIFDVEDVNNNPLFRTDKVSEAQRIGLEVVPQLRVDISSKEDLLKVVRDTESILGDTKIEGIVVKNYNKFTLDGKYYCGKYVSESFKERHQHEWKKVNPSRNDVVQIIIGELTTTARFNKAVQHLRESGNLTETPSDIGNLLKEVHKDIDDEEKDYISDKLYQHFIRQVKRGVSSNLPKWYKSKLLDNLGL